MRLIALKNRQICAVFCLALLANYASLQRALADHIEARTKILSLADEWKTDLENGQNSASRLFRRHLRPILFLDGIAYFITRPHWNNASASERKEFLGVFAKKVEMDFECDIERYFSLEAITVGQAEELPGGYSVVYTRIRRAGRQPVSLVWKFMKDKRQALRLFDVIAEGFSSVKTYRDEYRRILKDAGLSGLTAELANNVGDTQPCPPAG